LQPSSEPYLKLLKADMTDSEKKAAVQAAMNAPITANLISYSNHVGETLFRQFPDATWHVRVHNYKEYTD
jgi:hypothetical protein